VSADKGPSRPADCGRSPRAIAVFGLNAPPKHPDLECVLRFGSGLFGDDLETFDFDGGIAVGVPLLVFVGGQSHMGSIGMP